MQKKMVLAGRLLRAAALFAVAATLLCAQAMAAHSGTWKNLKWTLNNEGVLKITGRGEMGQLSREYAWLPYRTDIRSVEIGEGITTVGFAAFIECGNMTSIALPSTITAIDGLAFNECKSLKSITLPQGVTRIGEIAFYSCESLEKISIPSSVNSLGSEAFGWCVSLKSVTLPEGITSLPYEAFYACESLVSVSLPESLTSIGEEAFASCASLTELTIPKGVRQIADRAFYACEALARISMPPQLTALGEGVFEACRSLGQIVIPDGITEIRDQTFCSCKSLAEVVIPDSVTRIGREAFSNCGALERIMIPDGVTSVDPSAFYFCHVDIYAHADTDGARALCRAEYGFRDPDLPYNLFYIYSGETIIGSRIYNVDPDIRSFSFPEGVISIGFEAFSGCVNLTSLVIPEGVTDIQAFAFEGCRSLVSLSLPEGVTCIDDYTFYNCSSLRSLILPQSVTGSIGLKAFCGCEALTSLAIPQGITSIGIQAFMNCKSLESISIPDSVKEIGIEAFWACSNLKSIVIPDGVTSLGEGTFYGCTRMRSVALSSNLTSIGENAFRTCTNIRSITIPESVEQISDNAFRWADIENVTFLGTDADIGTDVFTYNPTVYCHSGSAIERWAKSMSFATVNLDGLDPDAIRTISLAYETLPMDIGDTALLVPAIFPDFDHPKLTWISSNPQVASVADGRLEARAYGSCVITAAIGSASASVTVPVYRLAKAIAMQEPEVWVLNGDPVQLAAVLEPEDAERHITWESEDPDAATVDDEGMVTTLRPVDVTIRATTETGLTAEALIHICNPVTAISFASPHETLTVGETLQLTANVTMGSQSCVNHLISFFSGNETIATVDDEGRVTALQRGKTYIGAWSPNGCANFCDITVLNPVTSLLKLPDSLTEIGSLAFAHMGTGYGIVVPETVVRIADDAFTGTEVTLIAPADSYAATWAAAHEEVDWREP